jgi:hypothetical protein
VNGAYVLDNATKAMIASLDSQEERDRLTRFITVDLRDGKGTGILGDLFLLLKANRCYLEKLPGQFNRELVQPLTESMLRLETSTGLQLKAHKEGLTQLNGFTNSATSAAQRMEAVVPKVDKAVQSAFDKIDTRALTQQITDTVVKSAVEPVAKTNKELKETAKLLRDLVENVHQVISVLKEVNLKGILIGCFGTSFAICAFIFIFAYLGVRHSYDDSLETQNQKLRDLAATIEKVQSSAAGNQKAYDELTSLQVPIEIKPMTDTSGNPLGGQYVLIFPGADAAQMQADGKGVISFHGDDLSSLILRQMEENRKLLGH